MKLRGEPGAVEVLERAIPKPGPEEILVKVGAASVCASDIHAYHYARGFEYIKPPFVIGHEFVGEIVEMGDSVQGFMKGERIVSEAVHYCGHCLPCTPRPDEHLRELPDHRPPLRRRHGRVRQAERPLRPQGARTTSTTPTRR